MAYWCDDRALDREQRRLDAEQQRAVEAMERRRRWNELRLEYARLFGDDA